MWRRRGRSDTREAVYVGTPAQLTASLKLLGVSTIGGPAKRLQIERNSIKHCLNFQRRNAGKLHAETVPPDST